MTLQGVNKNDLIVTDTPADHDMTSLGILTNKLSIKVLTAVISNLVSRTHKVALRVATDVVGVKLRSRIHSQVRVRRVCFDDILGEAREWAHQYNDKDQSYHVSS